jgi:hypothetical protein
MDKAQAHLMTVLVQVERGIFRRDESVSVKHLFEDHWLHVKGSEGRSKNAAAFHRSVAKGIIARIGGLRVESLAPARVAKMQKAMEADRRSAQSWQAAIGTLKAATAWTARPSVHLIAVDQLADYHPPWVKGAVAPSGIKAWSVEQARHFIASASHLPLPGRCTGQTRSSP